MNLHIDPVNGLLVAIGFVVGYLVYRRPAAGTGGEQSTPMQGDLVGGTTAALATILILAFLFGLGDGTEVQVEDGAPGPVPTVSRPHTADPASPEAAP
ncbi:hypothetical protein [Streptomyces europaeiscabiei]|uniref:hypothetical protein n=1 Tax=Streptomyces europaeiscabiei TaxID=146819 RepID=UPI000765B7FF|nr:hypothetical protein [Streptomyces europaeiscabiei]MDX2762395.1 hypothetical protein [Streptomyces europaeiscabiei]MDX3867556.1 hypothetical protein [Streptomyces europaeiscabiei]